MADKPLPQARTDLRAKQRICFCDQFLDAFHRDVHRSRDLRVAHLVIHAQYERETNYLRVYMAQVRRKLEPLPSRPKYFITEPGMGYRFSPTPNHA